MSQNLNTFSKFMMTYQIYCIHQFLLLANEREIVKQKRKEKEKVKNMKYLTSIGVKKRKKKVKRHKRV